MKLGIVGLPNVGKSTLFNAMTNNEVDAQNYPFCTIDPNVGVVKVPDSRLDNLARWFEPEEKTPAVVEFTDIAGLVKNAHEGEGLGNQFLAQIREVDALCHILRVFDDRDVGHVEGNVDPVRDMQIIETEFMLADLEMVENRLEGLKRKTKSGDEEAVAKYEFYRNLRDGLSNQQIPDPSTFTEEKKRWLKSTPLLSLKPVLYVLNVDEQTLRDPSNHDRYQTICSEIEEQTRHEYLTICADLESEMIGMDREEKMMFLEDLGLEEPGLDRLARAGYKLLDRITFFTGGEKEVRAWTVGQGALAPEAAGRIHTDFEEGFIRAETIHYDQFKKYRDWTKAKDAGAVRTEGKDYVVQDGDIMMFRFNV